MATKYFRLGSAIVTFGLLASSCDTTEDAYHLGDLGDVSMTTIPASQLRLAADGKPKEIEVRSNVYWDVQTSGNHFTVKALTDKGNGTVTVEAPVNVNTEKTPSETVVITARDFDKKISIEVIQARLRFEMADADYPQASEDGGEVTMNFDSSIDWKFVARSGDVAWLEFDPGLSGAGEWDSQNVKGKWTPNYTTSERTLELQLSPQDEDLLEFITRPRTVSLTQAPGTLPYDLGVTLDGEAGMTTATFGIRYKSKAPVEECGVILLEGGTETRYPAAPSDAGFPNEGNFSIDISGLTPSTAYTARPYVISKVGESVGDMFLTFTTKSDVTWRGAAITGIVITPSLDMVKALVSVNSDCELVEGGIRIFDATGYELVEYTVPLIGKSQSFECASTDFLTQNTEYALQGFVVYTDPKLGNVEVTSETKRFRTTYRSPSEDDNRPIE